QASFKLDAAATLPRTSSPSAAPTRTACAPIPQSCARRRLFRCQAHLTVARKRDVMQTLIDLIRREPVLSQGAMQAIFACGVAFGMPISQQQLGALLAV